MNNILLEKLCYMKIKLIMMDMFSRIIYSLAVAELRFTALEILGKGFII